MKLTIDELEYMLGKAGAVETSIKSDPKPQVQDVMMSSLRNGNGANNEDSSDDNDW